MHLKECSMNLKKGIYSFRSLLGNFIGNLGKWQLEICHSKNLFPFKVFAVVIFITIPRNVVIAGDFQAKFWPTQFGVAYTPGQSGLVLSNGTMNEGFLEWKASAVETVDFQSQIVANGSFLEDFRSDNIAELSLSESILSAGGLSTYSHYAVSRIFINSMGVNQATYGIMTEIILSGHKGSRFIFLPMGITDDLAFAADAAETLRVLFVYPIQAKNLKVPGIFRNQPHPPGWRNCALEESNCIDSAKHKCAACMGNANSDWKGEAAGCLGAALLCAPAGGILGYGICMAACEAVALSRLADKLEACSQILKSDKLDCANMKLQCDSFNNGLGSNNTPTPDNNTPTPDNR
jgi:hypothetical protein